MEREEKKLVSKKACLWNLIWFELLSNNILLQIADIKKMAADNQMKAVQIQAKELVRTRNFITKFLQMRAHLNAVLLKIQTVKSHEAVSCLF